MLFLLSDLQNKVEQCSEEMADKLCCMRLICGLCKVQNEDASPASLVLQCLNMFDKVLEIYPYSPVEKSHMRSVVKLQV